MSSLASHLAEDMTPPVRLGTQGAECYQTFLSWSLPKTVLKDIWAVVAGDNGELTEQQFLACLYLMDLARRGVPPPSQLPPGQFPPLASAAPAPSAAPASDLTPSQVTSPRMAGIHCML